jgi:hypothetical protein
MDSLLVEGGGEDLYPESRPLPIATMTWVETGRVNSTDQRP